jgi:PAS domain-containing protein
MIASKRSNFELLINSQSITIKLFCRVIPCDKDEFLVMVEHSIVSHEKNATQSLKDNLLLLSNHLDDVVWTMDLDGKITFVSYQITDLIGYLPTEMMQMHFSQILTPASYKNAITILNNELEIARSNQKIISSFTRLNLTVRKMDYHLDRSLVSYLDGM